MGHSPIPNDREAEPTDEEADAWMIEGRIDLRFDTAPEGPMIWLTRIGV